MECEPIQDLLPWRLNGSLGEEEKKQVDDHLAQCEDCRRVLEESAFVGRAFGEHPSSKELVAYVLGEAEPAAAAYVVRHAAVCPRCAESLAMVRESRRVPELDLPGPSNVVPFRGGVAPAWRPFAVAATLAALVLGASLFRAQQNHLDALATGEAAERRAAAHLELAAEAGARATADVATQSATVPPRQRGASADELVIEAGPEVEALELDFDCTSGAPVLFEDTTGTTRWVTLARRSTSGLPRCRARLPTDLALEAGRLRLFAADAEATGIDPVELVFRRAPAVSESAVGPG
jgi:hypothetical protein